MKTYTATAAIKIEGFTAFSDGSGAPCVVSVGDFVYGCNLLGEVSLHCVRHPVSSRVASKVASERARAAYMAHVVANTTEEWREANRQMYVEAI